MCGIFFSLSYRGHVFPNAKTEQLLRNRGPDSYNIHTLQLSNNAGESNSKTPGVFLTFASSVLALRGGHVQSQPLVDPKTGSVLCWNGEAWRIQGDQVMDNDSKRVFDLLLDAISASNGQETNEAPEMSRLGDTFASVSGPSAFVFYDAIHSRVIFGRDILGRRSLLRGVDLEGNFQVGSVCDPTSMEHSIEVESDGIHVIDLRSQEIVENRPTNTEIKTIPWIHSHSLSEGEELPEQYMTSPLPQMNMTTPGNGGAIPSLTQDSVCVKNLETSLRRSVDYRVRDIPDPPNFIPSSGGKVAVLFSGGLDCTILARLIHDIIPKTDSIDLLNVAFENPRVVSAAAAANGKHPNKGNQSPHPPGPAAEKPAASVPFYETCPDRLTGRSSLHELRRSCPERNWRFVAINIPYTLLLEHKSAVIQLMHPHNTEMDFSIACALYFASRGVGSIECPSQDDHISYETPARVLLSGIGADEVFAGYTRHGIAFRRNGFPGLLFELHLDVSRLGKRNLGRDDRVLSNWRREVRYPFLDEQFLNLALNLPVWEKTGFGHQVDDSQDEYHLDPEKKALRLLAWRLGLRSAAKEKKRAIQFGSRTAKMQSGRSKGTQLLDSTQK